MFKKYKRLDIILEKIEYIYEIISDFKVITNALNDKKMGRASILMHLISIAEQFNKLKDENEFEILSKFEKSDLKGAYDIRNFIAHDYEGINLMIIEMVIRDKLPKIKDVIIKIKEQK